MIYELKINDSTGRTQKWWINFLVEIHSGSKLTDIEEALSEHNAKPILHDNATGDSIGFDNEEDMTWFLLKYS